VEKQTYNADAIVVIGVVILLAGAVLWGHKSSQNAGAPPAAQAAPGSVAPASSITWESTFESAQMHARSSNKPMLVDFYADWCPACKYMQGTFAAPEVTAIAGNVVAVRVNVDQRNDLSNQYNIRLLPTLMAMDSNGAVIGSTNSGPPDEFATWLRGVFPTFAPPL